MTRVSLKEAYDNKDVVAQIYAIRDIAEGAEYTANGALSTANTASEHVDALVPQVEGAVQNANNASASAQQSANTVEGYDARLTAAETKNTQQDTAIDALQTADTQNVKLGGDQFITGQKTFVVTRTKNSLETKAVIPPQQRQTQPVQVIDGNDEQVMFNQLLTNTNGTRQYRTNLFAVNGTRVVVENIFLNADGTGYSTCVNPSANAPSSATVNKAYVESTDGVTNNLVHRTANETISGVKDFVSQIKLSNNSWRFDCVFPELDNANPSAVTGYIRICAGSGSVYEIGRIQYSIRDNGNRYFALYLVDKNGGYHSKVLFEIDNDGNVVV